MGWKNSQEEEFEAVHVVVHFQTWEQIGKKMILIIMRRLRRGWYERRGIFNDENILVLVLKRLLFLKLIKMRGNCLLIIYNDIFDSEERISLVKWKNDSFVFLNYLFLNFVSLIFFLMNIYKIQKNKEINSFNFSHSSQNLPSFT